MRGMRCTPIIEPAEPKRYTWRDNYLCVPKNSPYNFRWFHRKPSQNQAKHCLKWVEPADPNTWKDNYLCIASQARI